MGQQKKKPRKPVEKRVEVRKEAKQQLPKKPRVEMSKEVAEERILRTGGAIRDRVISHPHPGLRVLSAIGYLVRNHDYTYIPKGDK